MINLKTFDFYGRKLTNIDAKQIWNNGLEKIFLYNIYGLFYISLDREHDDFLSEIFVKLNEHEYINMGGLDDFN